MHRYLLGVHSGLWCCLERSLERESNICTRALFKIDVGTFDSIDLFLVAAHICLFREGYNRLSSPPIRLSAFMRPLARDPSQQTKGLEEHQKFENL